MTTETDFHLSGNGKEQEEETPEQLEGARIRLGQLLEQGKKDGGLVTFGKQELSLMQKVLSTGSDAYREEQFWRMCSFLDDDEAKDHVAAFYEAKDLGMDTSFNVAYAFALCSVNRRIGWTNLVGNMLDTMQHGKWAQAPQGSKKDGTNPRSPLN